MQKLGYIAVLTGLSFYLPTLSHAENGGAWTIKSGLSLIIFDESADVFLGGNQVPGASFTTDNDQTITASLDYRYNASWSVEVTVGIPPEATLNGSGPLDGLTLGKVTYAPATLTALYHLPAMSESLDFYVGGGLNYTIVMDTEDATVTNFEADNAFAMTVQAGVNGSFNQSNLGWYLDAKYIALDTDATGFVGPAPAKADITLNPLIVTAGLTYAF
ncbi:OmpW/AlkL family protein [Alteromonas lipolytica]|uniref:OmpW family protein n=1 Tax=Alteromonas lipolytica TaxID=1856405 RepID=A0A1E8F8U5_9ALTE|nr:OmpW family outer membrane protein [Alteromonas lipolytica]OFI32196.1 hypothetical protein BFC17_08215 [Alteromonas lipolytica]GGF83095.1 outer membrane protein OmpW [Alteromonas lipolytica]